MNICKICKNANRKEIDMRLVKGDTLRSLATEFDVTVSSLFSHKTNHLGKLFSSFNRKQEKRNGEIVQFVEEAEQIQLKDNMEIIRHCDFAIEQILEIFQEAREGQHNLLALKALEANKGYFQLLINYSAQMHANKVLELQILKEKSGEADETTKEKFAQNIKILSFEELKIMGRLIEKVNNQEDEILILDGKVL